MVVYMPRETSTGSSVPNGKAPGKASGRCEPQFFSYIPTLRSGCGCSIPPWPSPSPSPNGTSGMGWQLGQVPGRPCCHLLDDTTWYR